LNSKIKALETTISEKNEKIAKISRCSDEYRELWKKANSSKAIKNL